MVNSRLDGIYAAGAVLSGLLLAWIEELRGILPARWNLALVKRKAPLRVAVILDPGEAGSPIQVLDGADRAYGEIPDLRTIQDRLVHLVVADRRVLSKLIEVPRSAARNPERLLADHLAVWTPFTFETAFATVETIKPAAGSSRTPPSARVPIRLTLVAKTQVMPDIATLEGLGLAPDAIELGRSRQVVRLDTAKRRHLGIRAKVKLGLAGIAAVQCLILLAMWDGRRAAELESHRLAWQQRVRQARAAQEQNDRQVADRRIVESVLERSVGSRSVTHFLSALAGAIPTEAHLRELQLSTEPARGSLVLVSEREITPNDVLLPIGVRPTDMNSLLGAHARQQVHAISFEYRPPVSAAP